MSPCSSAASLLSVAGSVAIVAVGHSLLVIGYYLLSKQCAYQDFGPDYFDRINAEGLKRYLVKRLESLG